MTLGTGAGTMPGGPEGSPGAAVPESKVDELKEGTGDNHEIVAIFEDMEAYVERFEGLMEKANNQQGGG